MMSNVLDVIAGEARAHRTVLIEGRKKDGTEESREVEPYSIGEGREGHLLVFFCLKRGATRSLLLDNVLSAEPTGRSFEPRYEVEL
jgi:predicted DNA-binding transcriptional regulator YafY